MGELRGLDRTVGFALLMLVAACCGLICMQPLWVAGVAIVALGGMTASEGNAALGLANAVTWGRILATAALCYLEPQSLILALVAFLIFAFDGVDGAIARATNTATKFGAELDKECDAFFVLMVGMILWHQGTAGVWIVIPGLWRYSYSLIVAGVRELRPAPRSNWGRYSYSTSCVCMILSLSSYTPLTGVLCAVATCLISASFLRSLYYCVPRSPR